MDDKIIGVVRLVIKTKTGDELLRENRSHMLISLVLQMGIALLGTWFLCQNQNHHLARRQELRDQLHQAERLSALGQLAESVAHEIPNPLNTISIAVRRLGRESQPKIVERKEGFVELILLILDEISRLNGIVEVFLTFSRCGRQMIAPYHFRDFVKKTVGTRDYSGTWRRDQGRESTQTRYHI